MEVFSSFLLLVLTWTAEKTFCKSTSWNMSSTTENQFPFGESRHTTRGDEEKVFFETTDGGQEVEMMDNDRRLHTTGPGGPGGPDSKEEAETMTLIDDMWLTEDQLPEKMRKKTGGEKAGLFRNGKVNRRYRWPNKILYYSLTGRFSTWQRQQLKETLRRLERRIGSNCVKFRRWDGRWDAVKIRQGSKCSAAVGYKGSTNQRMSLGRKCWRRRGTIMHEFLHSLGIHHTQNRWDRDKYVHVNFRNIPRNKKGNFELQPREKADFFRLPYDYDSVMHYEGSDFARNPNIRTIVTKKLAKAESDWSAARVIRGRCEANQENVPMQLKL